MFESNPLATAQSPHGWQDGTVKSTTVTADEGPRAGVTAESLGKLKPVPLTKTCSLSLGLGLEKTTMFKQGAK